MQQVSRYLQSTKLGKQQDSSARNRPMPQTVMDRLWLRMAEIYGHRWVSSYGVTPNDTWANALGGFDMDAIKRGLDKMLEANIEWPPTLTEFIAHCKPSAKAPEHQLFKLPKLAEKTEKGRKASKALVQMMKGGEA